MAMSSVVAETMDFYVVETGDSGIVVTFHWAWISAIGLPGRGQVRGGEHRLLEGKGSD